uniref:Uncharacterized protein n=1 Tax=Minutocellus polymorphus TaxID=265543 RepID=A0A7S0FMC0_9STRA|mmetsp:Transcript_17669/g.29376  ORF Transcript_17669/g.29376 Transcript_17669/m.29376 type:complete len:277 (+) Transcript_17669:176-1006(+)
MLRASTSTRFLDNSDAQNQDDERLSVAAIFFIVLAAVAIFAVGMLYLCSIVRSRRRRRRNKDEGQTRDVVIEPAEESADEETATLEPFDLVSCASECSVEEKKDVLDTESTLPDPSDLGRQHAAQDVHHCTSACCDVCRPGVPYPSFLAVDRPPIRSQEETKRPDGVEEGSVEVVEVDVDVDVDVEAEIDLAMGSDDKSKADNLATADKEKPEEAELNSDRVRPRISSSRSTDEGSDAISLIGTGGVRISVTNSGSIGSEEGPQQQLRIVQPLKKN